MSGNKSSINQYKHFRWLLVFVAVFIMYRFCESLNKPRYYIESSLDSHIPFIKGFIVPYLLWFVYIGFGFIYLGLKSKGDYYRLFIMMVPGLVICYLIYFFFPNGQNLRPVVTDDDIFSLLIRFIHRVDSPDNVCPSIHVFKSIVIHGGLVNSRPLRGNALAVAASWVTMVSICASTVLIKQHSILDVIWGAVLGIVLFLLVYKVKLPLGRSIASPESES
ncbi:MAG: phosphatidic acid phosphatase [Mahellales bacterium]|jgi:membrane-associated phospholipid phosphatase